MSQGYVGIRKALRLSRGARRPRRWSSSGIHYCVCVCLLLQYLLQSCSRGGHALRETTRRGLRGLVCPSQTSERGGEGDCVKEGGGGEGEREKERAQGLLL